MVVVFRPKIVAAAVTLVLLSGTAHAAFPGLLTGSETINSTSLLTLAKNEDSQAKRPQSRVPGHAAKNKDRKGFRFLFFGSDQTRIDRRKQADVLADEFDSNDPEEGDSGYGLGNLTYVPPPTVSLGGSKFETVRPADAQAAAVFDALSDPSLDIRSSAEIRKAIVAHYEATGFAPLWIESGKLSERARAIAKVLAAADGEGLDASDYRPASLTTFDLAPHWMSSDPASVAKFDLDFTARVLKYASDASGGRFEPSRLSRYYDVKPERVEPARALSAIAWLPFGDQYLKSLQPRHPAYAAMKAALAEINAAKDDTSSIDIPNGPKVKKGASDPRIRDVRIRLLEMGISVDQADLAEDPDVLDDDVAEALKELQRKVGLRANGVLDAGTIYALNHKGSEKDRLRLIANMERLRWLPKDLGKRYVFVNQPAFEVRVIDDGIEEWQSRVIVGKPNTQTSVFNDEIEMVVFNPSWGVPPSIIANEYLPKLRRDPGYLDRLGFKVATSDGKVIPSRAVNWSSYGRTVPFSIQQPPGRKNALGELKFLFPNSHHIYMHDTPNRELFQEESRAFSHGCVRVENPREFAQVLLGWDPDKVDKEVDSKQSQTVKLQQKLPIYITYFTAWPDDTGKIQYFNDIYERDQVIERALQPLPAAPQQLSQTN